MKFKNSPTIVTAALILAVASTGVSADAQETEEFAGPYQWQETKTTLALLKDEKVVWQHKHDPEGSRPYFHPLNTPAGFTVSGQPSTGHTWHYGLWWGWKYINGVNYWEEEQGRSDGTTSIRAIDLDARPDYSARITIDVAYHPPDQKDLLLERREITVSTPTADGAYTIEWHAVFTATEDLRLDRTPIPADGGPDWGGYAGLSFRASPAMRDQQEWTFSNQEQAPVQHGEAAESVSLSGPEARVTIIPDPDNARMPNVWYVNGDMPFFQPAFLMEKGIDLEEGERLEVRYTIMIEGR